MSAPKIKLNNGLEIPAIGLGQSPSSMNSFDGSLIMIIIQGTWQSKPGEVASAVEYAIKEVGYRHIDCAW